jgi:hypothetical protein
MRIRSPEVHSSLEKVKVRTDPERRSTDEMKGRKEELIQFVERDGLCYQPGGGHWRTGVTHSIEEEILLTTN